MKLVYDDRRIEIVLMPEECAWPLNLDAPLLGRRRREIPLVARDDNRRAAPDRGS